jgi:hypothetical protein
MKPHITFDVFRGILAACAIRDAGRCLMYLLPINFPWSSVPAEQRGLVLLLAVVIIAFYSGAVMALLSRPASTRKWVFWLLVGLSVVMAGCLSFFGLNPQGHSPGHSLSLLRALQILLGPPLTAAIALFCVLRLKYG